MVKSHGESTYLGGTALEAHPSLGQDLRLANTESSDASGCLAFISHVDGWMVSRLRCDLERLFASTVIVRPPMGVKRFARERTKVGWVMFAVNVWEDVWQDEWRMKELRACGMERF